jgi:anti-sigma B factor antagonist
MRENGTFKLSAEASDGLEATTSAPSPETAQSAPAPASLSFAVSHRELDEQTSVVTVEGELDLASAPSLKWALTDLLDAGATQIVVDLGHVRFIDSTALGVLVGVHRNLTAGARMAIAGATGDVLNIFEMTGLDATFEMFGNLDEALAWVRGSAAATG